MTIKETIQKFLKEAKDMPDDTRTTINLWDERNYKLILISFYEDLLAAIDHPTILSRLSECDLSGDALSTYKIINAGGHPIRDGLILFGMGFLD